MFMGERVQRMDAKSHNDRLAYRPEIDGLRAIAVLPVIGFHAGWTWINGGYLGVDVFFVISGYLITSILLADLREGSYSILTFYERRARRILPALVVVVLVSLPAAYFLMLPHQFDDFAKSVIGVGLFLSNFQFWWEEGYFGAAAELKPLLHSWSLAVEEQFYILYPLLLVLIWRRHTLVFLAVLAILSLALAEWTVRQSPNTAFFLLPFRGWELLAGAICALLPSRQSGALAALGLAMILGAMLIYDPYTRFPGLGAVPPVLGASLIICFSKGSWLATALAWRPLVFVGLISYSTYLWHQPIFAFARLSAIGEPSATTFVLLALMSLGMGWLSWRYVERPFRGAAPLLPARRVLLATAAGCLAGLVLLGSTLDNTRFFSRSLGASQSDLLAYTRFAETEAFAQTYRTDPCFLDPGEVPPDTCFETDPDRANILLLGDSHAGHLRRAIEDAVDPANLVMIAGSACRPLLPPPPSTSVGCGDLLQRVLDRLPRMDVDHIVLSARWFDDDVALIEQSIDVFASFGVPVTVIGPNVAYEAELPIVLHRLGSRDDISHAASVHLDADRFDLARDMAPLVEGAGADYVDLAHSLCPDRLCDPWAQSGVPIIWDKGHFTPEGAVRAVEAIQEAGQFGHLTGATH